MAFRRFFWNFKESFIGLKFVASAPVQGTILIGAVMVPFQIAMALNKSNLHSQ